MTTKTSSLLVDQARATIDVPVATAWPIMLAFGVALLLAGLATGAMVSVAGTILAAVSAVGWFRDVLPHEAHESVAVATWAPAVATSRHEVARLEVARTLRRAWLPLEVYPVSAGIKGGLAGGVAMAAFATLYGVISGHGVWYPINLLSAGFFPGAMEETAQDLSRFQATPFAIAFAIHWFTSLVVGLLYGAVLPMLPRRPIVLGGLLAPIVWTGLLHSIVGIVNPVLNQRIDWLWFVLSQLGFGLVAGIVVSRQERIDTWQTLPFAIRAGIETSGIDRSSSEKDEIQ
jgi:hypothetical protein